MSRLRRGRSPGPAPSELPPGRCLLVTRRPLLSLLLVLLLLSGASGRAPAQGQTQIHWFGHSCFLIVSPGGTRTLIDPFPPDVGYPSSKVPADVVLVTSNLFDHKYLEMAEGSPRILHGLTREGEWTRIKATVGDVRIRALPSYQDSEGGTVRGKNSMFLLETGGMRLLHAGNLGHTLDKKALADLGRIDVFMVPVGGIYTINGNQAAALVQEMCPRIAIPMHFKTPALRFQLNPPDKFLKHFPDYQKARNLSLDRAGLPSSTRVYLLDYLRS